MSPSIWGPPIWTLFHCLVEKIKEDQFSVIGPQVFGFIQQICRNLPCPDCTQHATFFLSKVNPMALTTQHKMKTLISIFHNTVNKRKNKPQFDINSLVNYKSLNLIVVFNNFLRVYNTRGNMKLLSDTFHRTQLTLRLKKWLTTNIVHFNV
jgi:hypothetical protein